MADAAIAPRLLTAKQLADYLSVSEPTVRRMAARGDLPAPVRLPGPGRVTRWDRTTVDTYLDGLAGERRGYEDPDDIMAGLRDGRESREAAAGRRHR